jgi:hypothetical protein
LAISTLREIAGEGLGTAVSLLFARGRRPRVEVIRQLSENQREFSISIDPSGDSANESKSEPGAGEVWLELLANGLTFDLVGLAPGPGADPPPCVHGYALPADADPFAMEALTVRPGPHLAGGHTMTPVVRTLARLGADLAALQEVRAVAWHPARSWCGAQYFRDSVRRWIEGGVFPSLGLTALAMSPDGGMHSEGLALFVGQELRLEPGLLRDKAAGAKIGVRLIDLLVEEGKVEEPRRIAGPDGQSLRLEPSANGHFVRVWQG